MSNVDSVNKTASPHTSLGFLKIGLCTAALVLTCNHPVLAQEEVQATSSLSSVPQAKNAAKSATTPRGVGATGAIAPSTATTSIQNNSSSLSPSKSDATSTLTSSLASSSTNESSESTGTLNKDLHDAINSDAVAIDHSGAYISAQDSSTESARVAVSSEQISSTIKERPKVYRDPYGNRLKEPPRKQSFEERTQEQARNAETLEEQNFQRPTSSLTKAVAASSDNQGNGSVSSSISGSSLGIASSGQRLKSAVVYFSKPEKSDTHNVDAMSGASTVMRADGTIFGITEHQANLIAKYTKGDLYRLVRSEPYSTKHTDLVFESSEEMDAGIRPDSKLIPMFDPSGYDVIFVGFPTWWSDMPMPLYTFFNDHDLSGKIVIPFCTYGSSSKNKIFTKISKLEPNADVAIKVGIKTQRAKIAHEGDAVVKAWLGKLDSTCFKGLLPSNSPAKPTKKSVTIDVNPSLSARSSSVLSGSTSTATANNMAESNDTSTPNTAAAQNRANPFAPGKPLSVPPTSAN